MSDTHREAIRERLRDEIAHWPVGTGYYGTTVDPEIADAVLSVVDEETERLRESVDYLTARIDRADNATSDVMAERDALKAENERLRALVSNIRTCSGTVEYMGARAALLGIEGALRNYDRAALDTPGGGER